MLASLHPAASSCRVYTPSCRAVSASTSTPSVSCRSRPSAGLKSLSTAGAYGAGRPSPVACYFANARRSLRAPPNGRATRTRSLVCVNSRDVPLVPIKTPGSGRYMWIDLWNALYQQRIIMLGKTIDEFTSNTLLATMLYLDHLDTTKKIYIIINGPGGDLSPCLTVYDTILSLESPVCTQCIGLAQNMTGFILAAGTKGLRLALPLCRIYLEAPAASASGHADDVENEARELIRIRDYLNNQLSKHTGQPLEKVKKDLKVKLALSANEALEYGLIDKVIRPPKIDDRPLPVKKYGNTGLG